MRVAFFVADLHGRSEHYERLVAAVAHEEPDAVFLGGDLLTGWSGAGSERPEPLLASFERLRGGIGDRYPRVFLVLGNDDPMCEEPLILDGARRGLWTYLHLRHDRWDDVDVYGYACVPPTPFGLKDWERYDVSRHVDPGCQSPEEGWRTVPADPHEVRHATIERDLNRLTADADLSRAVCLFHAPPYETALDRAALDGRFVDHVPVDVHVGSIAVRRFIEGRQPLVTLHGHIHESARLTGSWRQQIGRTHMFSAAHDGPELALVRFDPAAPDRATRELI